MLQRRADMPSHADPVPPLAPPPPAAGPHHVQVLRTYAAKRPAFPFAPHGERTIARAYEHAFDRARQLIYIEDQYLWSDVVAATIATALRREPHLQVIAVVPRYPDDDGRITGPPNRLGQLSALALLRAAGGQRFGVFDPHSPTGTPVYVHAKVCIVDDTWMSCGSDNFNRRSWTHDSELTCAVMDDEGRLPRELRKSLWSEHLGLAADDQRLHDASDALGLWRERAGRPDSRIRAHEVEPVGAVARIWATPMYRTTYDPDGRPLRLRRRNAF
jgi:phosphatidylserine/phosphatidylglycerophosphate/cardiolipin synthase-like enzyme